MTDTENSRPFSPNEGVYHAVSTLRRRVTLNPDSVKRSCIEAAAQVSRRTRLAVGTPAILLASMLGFATSPIGNAAPNIVNSAAEIPPQAPVTTPLAKFDLGRLNSMVFKKLAFRGASMDEAIGFIERKTKELDPQKTGLTFLVDADTRASGQAITFEGTNLTLPDVIQYVALQARLAVTVVNGAVALKKSDSFRPPFQPRKASSRAETTAALILPLMQFRGASLQEAVDFLRKKERDLGPSGEEVPLIIDPDLMGEKQEAITLELTNAPFARVLSFAARLAGAEVICIGDAFYIQRRPPSSLEKPQASATPPPSSAPPSAATPPRQPSQPSATPAAPAPKAGIVIAAIEEKRTAISMAAGGHSHELEDVHAVLSNYGQASVDLDAHPEIEIFPGIRYLMPWRDAEKVVAPAGAGIKSGSKIACGGFPNGLTWVCYDGWWVWNGRNYNHLYLVKDIASQVVGLELVHETAAWIQPVGPWVNMPGEWHVIDYVKAQVKGQRGIQIVTQVLDQRKTDQRIVVHTTNGKLNHTATLFLPQPLINLMLYCTRDLPAK